MGSSRSTNVQSHEKTRECKAQSCDGSTGLSNFPTRSPYSIKPSCHQSSFYVQNILGCLLRQRRKACSMVGCGASCKVDGQGSNGRVLRTNVKKPRARADTWSRIRFESLSKWTAPKTNKIFMAHMIRFERRHGMPTMS